MKILFLAHRIPYPPNKGDKIRSFHEIKHLSAKHEIHVCCLADRPEDARYGKNLEEYCASVHVVAINPRAARLKSAISLFSTAALSVPYFYSRKLQARVNDLLKTHDFDCILCFSSPMAEYVFRSQRGAELMGQCSPFACDLSRAAALRRRLRLKQKSKNGGQTTDNGQRTTKLIMDFVDVDSDKWLQYARFKRWPLSWLYRVEGQRLAKYEQKISEQFNYSIVVSRKEAALFGSRCGRVLSATVVGNGVDCDYFSPQIADHDTAAKAALLKEGRSRLLLFTGAMDYYPNIDGVCWFCHEVFPLVRAQCPDAMFTIAGGNPHQEVRRLQTHEGVRVTGFVEDIRHYYHAADICVTPLRLARGVQNKVLEAMAMAKPVVTTSAAVQGIENFPNADVWVSDDPAHFAALIVELLNDTTMRVRLGQKNREWVMENYQWSQHMQKLEELIVSG